MRKGGFYARHHNLKEREAGRTSRTNTNLQCQRGNEHEEKGDKERLHERKKPRGSWRGNKPLKQRHIFLQLPDHIKPYNSGETRNGEYCCARVCSDGSTQKQIYTTMACRTNFSTKTNEQEKRCNQDTDEIYNNMCQRSMLEPMLAPRWKFTSQHRECVAAQELPPRRDAADALDVTASPVGVRHLDDRHPVGVHAQTVFLDHVHPQILIQDMFLAYEGSQRHHQSNQKGKGTYVCGRKVRFHRRQKACFTLRLCTIHMQQRGGAPYNQRTNHGLKGEKIPGEKGGKSTAV